MRLIKSVIFTHDDPQGNDGLAFTIASKYVKPNIDRNCVWRKALCYPSSFEDDILPIPFLLDLAVRKKNKQLAQRRTSSSTELNPSTRLSLSIIVQECKCKLEVHRSSVMLFSFRLLAFRTQAEGY